MKNVFYCIAILVGIILFTIFVIIPLLKKGNFLGNCLLGILIVYVGGFIRLWEWEARKRKRRNKHNQ